MFRCGSAETVTAGDARQGNGIAKVTTRFV